uniref:Anoctamin n=1 Tax=Brugia timori TaxID=42155 RepID=A0A0R3RB78_9BILA
LESTQQISLYNLWSYLLYRWSIVLYFVPLIVIILCKCRIINCDVRLIYGNMPDDFNKRGNIMNEIHLKERSEMYRTKREKDCLDP